MRLYATAGITEPDMTPEPLGTEGEMTPGPDDENPYENGDRDSQIDLPPLIGHDVPLGGDDVVDEMAEEADDRHERAMGVFEPTMGHGSFDPTPQDYQDLFTW